MKVGTKVIVTNHGQREAFEGTLPVGTPATVQHVYPARACAEYEVLLEGSGIYHFIENLTVVDEDIDPLALLRTGMVMAKAAGYEVEVKITRTVTEEITL